MYRLSAKIDPRLLTDGQKENRVSISQDMLANADSDEKFLKNILGLQLCCRNQNSIITIGEERVSSTEESTHELIKHQGVTDCLF